MAFMESEGFKLWSKKAAGAPLLFICIQRSVVLTSAKKAREK